MSPELLAVVIIVGMCSGVLGFVIGASAKAGSNYDDRTEAIAEEVAIARRIRELAELDADEEFFKGAQWTPEQVAQFVRSKPEVNGHAVKRIFGEADPDETSHTSFFDDLNASGVRKGGGC